MRRFEEARFTLQRQKQILRGGARHGEVRARCVFTARVGRLAPDAATADDELNRVSSSRVGRIRTRLWHLTAMDGGQMNETAPKRAVAVHEISKALRQR